MNSKRLWYAPMLLLALGLSAAQAAPVTFDFSSGHRAARATFDMVDGSLMLTLTNSSLHDVAVPSDVLTALSFSTRTETTFTPISATLGSGASVYFGDSPADGDVGGEWAYKVLDHPGLGDHGISSTGLGDIFGPKDLFGGDNLAGPRSPGGMEFGILSAGDDPTTGNAAVTGQNPFISNEVVFTLGGVAADFDPSIEIESLLAIYGTSYDTQNIFETTQTDGPGVGIIPVPTSFWPGVALMVGICVNHYLRRRLSRA